MTRTNQTHQPQFALTVDLAIFTVNYGKLCVLLICRGEDPFSNYWALPGGFVLPEEDVEDAARRELTEETGLDASEMHLEQLGTYGNPKRDPRMRVVSVAHVALVANLDRPVAGGDVSQAKFWPVDSLALGRGDKAERIPLAFDHDTIVTDAIERVRSKLEYTTLATAFVNEPFSLADIRGVYEAVWGKAPDVANFRRKVLSTKGFVLPAGKAGVPGNRGGRPAALYLRGSATHLHPPILRSEINT
ncbi:MULTISPECIES: NUDIX domain-containing protein [Acidithrix]|nr:MULTISPECIES: NUDIX domain-containing protein [Acidithrix]